MGIDMQAFQQRVVDEKSELQIKIDKLTAFIPTEIFRGLPKAEQNRLNSQLVHMRHYASILDQRIEAFLPTHGI